MQSLKISIICCVITNFWPLCFLLKASIMKLRLLFYLMSILLSAFTWLSYWFRTRVWFWGDYKSFVRHDICFKFLRYVRIFLFLTRCYLVLQDFGAFNWLIIQMRPSWLMSRDFPLSLIFSARWRVQLLGYCSVPHLFHFRQRKCWVLVLVSPTSF